MYFNINGNLSFIKWQVGRGIAISTIHCGTRCQMTSISNLCNVGRTIPNSIRGKSNLK